MYVKNGIKLRGNVYMYLAIYRYMFIK